METVDILTMIDREIAVLQQARAVLLGGLNGGLRKSGNGFAKAITPARKTKKHKVTPEGRKRISEAVKRRWAKQRKIAVK